MRYRRQATLAAALSLATGCAMHRGAFEPGLAAPATDRVAIAIVGGAGAVGPAATPTATALHDALAPHARATVLLLGDFTPHRRAHRGRRVDPSDAPAPVTAAVLGLRGAQVFALAGDAELGVTTHNPATRDAAVVRIAADGTARVISSCDVARCRIDGDGDGGVVELVLLDLQPWTRDRGRQADAAVARSLTLLDALATTPSSTPRVLALYLPVEGAFEHGLGSNHDPSAIFHRLPEALQRALQSGMFAGVVAGGERSLYVQPDLAAAIARSDRVFLERPLWQVVSGNAAAPRRGRIALRSAWVRGVGYRPPVATSEPGFAVLELGGEAPPRVRLYAQRHRHWLSTTVPLPIAPREGDQAPRTMPNMTPCMRCLDVPANERP